MRSPVRSCCARPSPLRMRHLAPRATSYWLCSRQAHRRSRLMLWCPTLPPHLPRAYLLLLSVPLPLQRALRRRLMLPPLAPMLRLMAPPHAPMLRLMLPPRAPMLHLRAALQHRRQLVRRVRQRVVLRLMLRVLQCARSLELTPVPPRSAGRQDGLIMPMGPLRSPPLLTRLSRSSCK